MIATLARIPPLADFIMPLLVLTAFAGVAAAIVIFGVTVQRLVEWLVARWIRCSLCQRRIVGRGVRLRYQVANEQVDEAWLHRRCADVYLRTPTGEVWLRRLGRLFQEQRREELARRHRDN